MSKMTEWFPAHIKPVRVGVYQRRSAWNTTTYSKWDGERWCRPTLNPQTASFNTFASDYQNWPWRGFTTPQEQSC